VIEEAPLRRCLLLQTVPPERLPEPEHLRIFDLQVRVNRAVYAADLGAKLMVLMAALDPQASQKSVGALSHGAP
jgi:hypothetical protein